MKSKITFFKTLVLVLAMNFMGSSLVAQTLEAHYEFSSNLNDASGNARTLNNIGSALNPYTTDNDGNINSAWDAHDATGEYLVATGYKGISGAGNRTVSAWVKLRAGTNRRTIASWGINSSGKMFNVMIEVGKIRVEGGTSSLISSGTVANGAWHHVAVTFDAADDGGKLNSVKMYIDGVLTSEGSNYNGTTVLNTDTATNDVRIGEAIYGTTHFYRGELNDVRIYSDALTAGEVATLAGVGGGPAPVADFTASNTTPSENEIITFTDSSTDSPTSWTWDFGAADAVGNTSAQNPQVSYPTGGTYTVTLTAANAGGTDDEVKTSYITVSGSGGSGDLLAHYSFDGVITDASSYSKDLSAAGAFVPTYENDHNANPSSALTTSGVYADHLITGYSGIQGGNDRTVAAWFKTTGTSREPIISWGVNSSGKMFNVMIDNGVPRVEAGASSLKTTDSGLNDDTWHHIAVTFDDADGDKLANCKIYIDGALSTNEADAGASYQSETTVLNADTGTNFLKVASTVYSTYAFDGAIDDVRIYSKALTAGEVTTVMSGGVLNDKDFAHNFNDIKLYPNPASNVVHVKTMVSNSFNVALYTILGKLVKQTTNKSEIDISNMPEGIYIVRVSTENKVKTFKVLKK